MLAFICEEVVSQCTLCGGLYFFEFVSCSAFLLSLLILIVYCTPVYDRVDAGKVKSSVSMKKHNPCIRNRAALVSSIVLLFKIVMLSKLSNMRHYPVCHVWLQATQFYLPNGMVDRWGKQNYSESDKRCPELMVIGALIHIRYFFLN